MQTENRKPAGSAFGFGIGSIGASSTTASANPTPRTSSNLTTNTSSSSSQQERHNPVDLPFLNFYRQASVKSSSSSKFNMYELERIMIRRMTILHTFQERQESLTASSVLQTAGVSTAGGGGGGTTATGSSSSSENHSEFNNLMGWRNAETCWNSLDRKSSVLLAHDYFNQLTQEEDAASHLLARLVFSRDPRWTDWFVKNEKLLFRAKLNVLISGDPDLRRRIVEKLPWIEAKVAPIEDVIQYYHLFQQQHQQQQQQQQEEDTINNKKQQHQQGNQDEEDEEEQDQELKGKQQELKDQKEQQQLYNTSETIRSWVNFHQPLKAERDAGKAVTQLYYVPFTAVKDLVRQRKVLLVGGRALIQHNQLLDYISQLFADHVRRETVRQRLHLQNLLQQHQQQEQNQQSTNNNHQDGGGGGGIEDADSVVNPVVRLIKMLENTFHRYIADPVAEQVVAPEGALTIDLIRAHAERHMPPCMHMMDDALRSEGHLKHHGRFQYGLFLKAIGLKMQDALKFWSQQMTLKGGNTEEQFNKSVYAYGIRHNYGKEGKHTDYSALTCPSMVSSPALTGERVDCHGCPFAKLDEAPLRRYLGNYNSNNNNNGNQLMMQNRAGGGGGVFGRGTCSPADIEDLVDDVRGKHYTRACRRFFAVTKCGGNLGDGQLFRSPSEFYRSSLDIEKKAAESPSETAGDRRLPESQNTLPNSAGSGSGSGSGGATVAVAAAAAGGGGNDSSSATTTNSTVVAGGGGHTTAATGFQQQQQNLLQKGNVGSTPTRTLFMTAQKQQQEFQQQQMNQNQNQNVQQN